MHVHNEININNNTSVGMGAAKSNETIGRNGDVGTCMNTSLIIACFH